MSLNIEDKNDYKNKGDTESSQSPPSGDLGDRVITIHSPATVANLVCGFDI